MKLLRLLLLVAIAAIAQDHPIMNERGDHAMGFSQEKTTHHFGLTRAGGFIEVTANDEKDAESRDQIRSHFHHIAQMFAGGNFNAPMLVHGKDVPGTATMSRLKDQIHWELLPTDGRI
jgi:hypothetical protein